MTIRELQSEQFTPLPMRLETIPMFPDGLANGTGFPQGQVVRSVWRGEFRSRRPSVCRELQSVLTGRQSFENDAVARRFQRQSSRPVAPRRAGRSRCRRSSTNPFRPFSP